MQEGLTILIRIFIDVKEHSSNEADKNAIKDNIVVIYLFHVNIQYKRQVIITD